MVDQLVTIKIKDKAKGSQDKTIFYDPDKPVGVKEDKDKIEWTCEHDFAVHIGNDSPLPKGRYAGEAKHRVGDKVKKVLREDEQYRAVKYSVSVWYEGRIWTDDPTFIIEP